MSEATPKRQPGRPKTVDRQRGAELAMLAYWSEGLRALSLNEVCRRASLSKPALYREFGDEDGLMQAALGHYRELMVLPILAAVQSPLPLSELLDKIVVAMTADRDSPAGCLFTRMRLDHGRLGPKTLASLGAIEKERLDAFRARAKRAKRAGELNPELSANFAARYLDTQLSSLLVQMGAGVEPKEARAQARLALRVLTAVD